MKTALFLSPHLDDAAFSCGGLAALLSDHGWRTILVTAFTATILPVTGFALACQLDKGLPPDTDYMAVRRAEDRMAASVLGFSDVRHLGLSEAPHRGYEDARALFGELRADDDVAGALCDHLAALQNEFAPDLLLAPQGLGHHVDHMQMVRAVLQTAKGPLAWFRDTPYAIRDSQAVVAHTSGLVDIRVCIDAAIDRKLQAVCAYSTQIAFQFGGPEKAGETLRTFARTEFEGERFGERLAVSPVASRMLRFLV